MCVRKGALIDEKDGHFSMQASLLQRQDEPAAASTWFFRLVDLAEFFHGTK